MKKRDGKVTKRFVVKEKLFVIKIHLFRKRADAFFSHHQNNNNKTKTNRNFILFILALPQPHYTDAVYIVLVKFATKQRYFMAIFMFGKI